MQVELVKDVRSRRSMVANVTRIVCIVPEPRRLIVYPALRTRRRPLVENVFVMHFG